MIRLGELLVRERVISTSQLEAAIDAQRISGERLGTCLVQLGHLAVDDLARALSTQQEVPAVLAQHVVAIDPQVIALLGVRAATTLHAIPLGITTGRPARLIVALRDPHTAAIEEIAFAAGMRVERMIAPETRIRECLLRYYGVKVETKVGAALPWAELDLEDKPVVDPFAEDASAWAQERPTRRREHATLSAPPPADAPSPAPPSVDGVPPPSQRSTAPPPAPYDAVVGAIPVDGVVPAFAAADDEDDLDHGWDEMIGKADAGSDPPPMRTAPPEALQPFRDVDATIAALRTASSRDEIGDVLVSWLRSAYGCGLVLMVKNGRAIGWKGYAPDAEQHEIEWIGVPLAPMSLLKQAYEGKVAYRGPPPPEGATLHERIWQLLRCAPPAEIIVGPVLLGGRVVNLLYAHPEGDHVAAVPASAIEDMSRVASAAATQYAKLIRAVGERTPS